MPRTLRPHFLKGHATATGLTACAVLAAASLALGQAEASIDVQEGDGPSSGSTLGAIQQVVSNTVEAMERMGLAVDPVEARQRVREALLTVADPGAVLLTQEDTRLLKDRAEGRFHDTGLRMALTNGLPVVSSVRAGSAAAEAGIEIGWLLERAGGRSTAEQHLPDLRRLLCDYTPGQVELVFRDEENESRTVTIEKQPKTLPVVEVSEVLPLDLRYLKVNSLRGGAGGELTETLRGWAEEGAFGVVLDLRGTGGADVDSVEEVVDLLARPGEALFSFEDAGGKEIQSYQSKNGNALGMPMMVLVDKDTSGAAEILAAAVSGSGRGAMLLGAPTAGDPMIRDRVDLGDGAWVYIATRRLVTAEGTVYDGKDGVKPDVIVVSRDRSYRDYEPPPPLLTDRRETTEEEKQTLELRKRTRGDVAFTRAVDVLLGLKALDIHGFGFEPRPER